MNVLLDTNVLISAFLGSGQCSRVLERCRLNHTLVTAPVIAQEFSDKLRTKFRLDGKDAADALAATFRKMRVVEGIPARMPFCRDPDDVRILAAAITGGCAVLVIGDADLLVLKEVEHVRILSPHEFMELTKDESDEP